MVSTKLTPWAITVVSVVNVAVREQQLIGNQEQCSLSGKKIGGPLGGGQGWQTGWSNIIH